MATGRITAELVAAGRGLSEPRLSPDGTTVAVVAVVGGAGRIVLLPADGHGPEVTVTSEPVVRSAPAYGGGAFDWLPDGSGFVVVGTDGDLWRVARTGGAARRLTTQPRGMAAAAPAVSPDGRSVAFVVGQQHVAVVPAEPGAGWPQRVSAGTADFAFDPAWSPDGRWLVWHEWDVPAMPWDAGRLVRASAGPHGFGEPEVVVDQLLQVQQPRWSPDGRLAFMSDAGGWLNVWVEGDVLADEPFEHGRPSWGQGQRSFCWSPDGTRIAYCRNERGFGRLCVIDVRSAVVHEVAKGVHGSLTWAGGRLAALRSGGTTPTQVVTYDDATWERTVVAWGPTAGWSGLLHEPHAVTWEADDGETLHGRLYLPAGAAPAADTAPPPPPMIVWVHGGPTDQWDVAFRPRIAYFVDRGWAVLVPDHRGSTGHGRAYTQALRGRWGELDVADCAAGVRAAVRNGWCHPDRVAVMGGSAGGFTALNLLAHHPGLFAAGVSLYGVADLLALADTTHRFEAHYLDGIVGALPAAADEYRRRSPLHVADRITAPLLVLQGDADEVVPAAQSEAVVARLRAHDRTVELHVYEGEGHGWGRAETVVDELRRVEAFLTRHVLRWRA